MSKAPVRTSKKNSKPIEPKHQNPKIKEAHESDVKKSRKEAHEICTKCAREGCKIRNCKESK